ncbi:carboxypeptidase-like regulatory domain-containing protein [Flavobacterium sp.]|uniref:carboxypeptidase-like regulatory domain-containing protein n=1 Tax=Flavobacterium sp. TaxID=239 RepID=UPI0025F1422F|nr:carboxypeptidase-like regulatory domain-containing protein [Flavobacterium sp.]
MKNFKQLKVLFFLFFVTVATAQITSSTLNGKVTDGELPIVNASILIIHLPTNASFETTTDKKGRFSLDNLDVGGPYRIIIKSKEIDEYKRTGIQLVLGENEMNKDIIVNRKENNTQKETSKTEVLSSM